LFLESTGANAFYLPGATGWDSTFSGQPTALWLPQAQAGGANFGVETNQFGFTINWADGQSVVVEACADLANPNWQPVQTNVPYRQPALASMLQQSRLVPSRANAIL
jgi:hypothetical protein